MRNPYLVQFPGLADEIERIKLHLLGRSGSTFLVATFTNTTLQRLAEAALAWELAECGPLMVERLPLTSRGFAELTSHPTFQQLPVVVSVLMDLPQSEKTNNDEIDQFLSLLNREREILVRQEVSVLLWIPKPLLPRFIHRAGDLWAWRSDAYQFTLDVDLTKSFLITDPLEVQKIAGKIASVEKDLEAIHDLQERVDLTARYIRLVDQLGATLPEVEALRYEIVKDKQMSKEQGLLRETYLHHIVERNLYLDPRGTLQTQRQVQVHLNEVYVSLLAEQELTPKDIVDRELLERELAELDEYQKAEKLSRADYEDRREHILQRYAAQYGQDYLKREGEHKELSDIAREHSHLVILGDPGAGKTTLLRYLALNFAQALLEDRLELPALGSPSLPVLIRISDYAAFAGHSDALPAPLRSGEEEPAAGYSGESLHDFIITNLVSDGHQPENMAEWMAARLRRGECLVMLDGLDEIISADDRIAIVRAVEELIRLESANRFIITSRIAGYRSAPLSEPFVHYTIQEMDEAQIQLFLEHWCPAVEAAQTPDLPSSEHQRKAQHEIEAIINAVQTSPGVRRLAANPLLLRILALIHRTGAQLPQRRIELYKLAADTLARTWRVAQGVPETALVEEKYLTRLLGRLAYWLHDTKPTGIATETEVYTVLGWAWADINRLPYDEIDPDETILNEVKKFLQTVRVQTGLFVERAPQRYGFMHLTFEEYYAARHMIARRRDTPRMIRRHLHDPRWEEPILLALGFVGLDYPDEASELLETAVLAQGAEAHRLKFEPSLHEDLLGRDYLFALRCLGDQIPVDPRLMRQLMQRLADELLYESGSARFRKYQQALEERLTYLSGSEAMTILIPLLLAGLETDEIEVRSRAAESLGQLDQGTPEVVRALLIALTDEVLTVRSRAAYSLGRLGQGAPEVVRTLLTALTDEAAGVRSRAAESLGQLGEGRPEVVRVLLVALSDEAADVRSRAAWSLGQLGQISPEVLNGLVEALKKASSWSVRRDAAQFLGQFGPADAEVTPALWQGLLDQDNDVRTACAQALAQLGRRYPEAFEEIETKLVQAIKDPKFDNPDKISERTGHDYAFDGLWMLITGELSEELYDQLNNYLRIEFYPLS